MKVVMTEDARTIVEWSYTPEDFFEEPIEVSVGTGTIVVENGAALGTFDASDFDRGAKLLSETDEALRREFLAQKVMKQETFQLTHQNFAIEYPDGRRGVQVFPGAGSAVVKGFSPAIIVHDGDGDVVSDSRAGRLAIQEAFRRNIARSAPAHPEIDAMLNSFSMSIEDEQNCFLHLYEITDRLIKIMGGKKRVEAELDKKALCRLGHLGNGTAHTASRHRGNFDAPEPVTPAQIEEGRDCARKLIESYLDYLNNPNET